MNSFKETVCDSYFTGLKPSNLLCPIYLVQLQVEKYFQQQERIAKAGWDFAKPVETLKSLSSLRARKLAKTDWIDCQPATERHNSRPSEKRKMAHNSYINKANYNLQ